MTTTRYTGPSMGQVSTIEIVQDCDYDEDSGLGCPMPSFWTEGHDHDPERFVRAVIDHVLDEHGSVPRIDCDNVPVEMWQRTIERQDSVEYERTMTKPQGFRHEDIKPITLLDLDRRSRGATRCGVTGCVNPWSSGQPILVRVEADDSEDAPYMSVQVWFCREHGRHFPEPTYRVCMVPVGATILLPAGSK